MKKHRVRFKYFSLVVLLGRPEPRLILQISLTPTVEELMAAIKDKAEDDA